MIEILPKEIAKLINKFAQESSFKEVSENNEYMNPVDYTLKTIENQSLESLRIENKANELKLADSNENHKTFYPKVDEDLKNKGYQIVPENELKGIRISNGDKKFDGLAIKENEVLLVEKKSSKEIEGLSDLSKLDADEDSEKETYLGELKKYYDELSEKVMKKELTEREAAHLFYIKREQIKVKATIEKGFIEKRDGTIISFENKEVKLGYSVPNRETSTVVSALKKSGYEFEKIEGKGSLTFKIKI